MPKSRNRQKQRPSRNKRIEKKIQQVSRLNQFVGSHIKKIESENERMKTNPESVIGQVIPQLRDALSQNKRLSVLAAALIESSGGKVKLTKEQLEAFETKVLSIKWELPEGVEKVDEASEFIFTYEALTQEEAAARAPQVTVTPAELSEEQQTTMEVTPEGGHYGRPTEEDEKAINELEAAADVEAEKFEEAFEKAAPTDSIS